MTTLFEARQGLFTQLKLIGKQAILLNVDINVLHGALEIGTPDYQSRFAECLAQTNLHVNDCRKEIALLENQLGLPIRAQRNAGPLSFSQLFYETQNTITLIRSHLQEWLEESEQILSRRRASLADARTAFELLDGRTGMLVVEMKKMLIKIADNFEAKEPFTQWLEKETAKQAQLLDHQRN